MNISLRFLGILGKNPVRFSLPNSGFSLPSTTDPDFPPNTQSAKHDGTNRDSPNPPLDHRHPNHFSISALKLGLGESRRVEAAEKITGDTPEGSSEEASKHPTHQRPPALLQ